MGAANMLVLKWEGRQAEGKPDRERPVDVLPNGSPWGQATTAPEGWVRIVVTDETKSDQEVFDALVPFVAVPDQGSSDPLEVELAQQGHKRIWRFMFDRLPPRVKNEFKQKTATPQELYFLTNETGNVPNEPQKRKLLDDEKRDKRAQSQAEVVGLTFDEFRTCLVDKRTGEDALGNPVPNSRGLRAGP